jgi:hypothetical protein
MRRLAAALWIAAALACAQPVRVPPPPEQAGRDPALAAYLTRLREAVRAKDRGALLGLISPEIKNGFGGEDGEVFFRRIWELDAPNSPVWGVLDLILSFRGAWFDPQLYCMPYIAVLFPGEFDAFTHSVVVGSGVRLREAPAADARIVGSLVYDVVEVLNREAEWTEVRTQDGKSGYVATAYLYSPISYRACIGKNEAGEWKMITLLAGD